MQPLSRAGSVQSAELGNVNDAARGHATLMPAPAKRNQKPSHHRDVERIQSGSSFVQAFLPLARMKRGQSSKSSGSAMRPGSRRIFRRLSPQSRLLPSGREG